MPGPVVVTRETESPEVIVAEGAGAVVVARTGGVVVTERVSAPTIVTAPYVTVSVPRPGTMPVESAESIVLHRVAGEDLSGHRVVRRHNGEVFYVDAADLSDMIGPFRLTMAAAAMGAHVDVLAYGDLDEPSWNWMPGEPIYLGPNGALTQTVPTFPTSLFLVQVAAAIEATSINFEPKMPILLS